MKWYQKLALLVVLGCFSTVAAQDATCSALVQQAMSAVQNGCAATERNQACYGYLALSATARAGVQNFTFSQQGDIANVADLDTLRLSALDPVKKTWGVALMKLQANLPATLPGQNVTFVLFGDVQINNAVAPAPDLATLQVTADIGATIRSGPASTYRAIGSLGAGDTATANGRIQDGSWLRIQLPNSQAQGWIEMNGITAAGSIDQLSVVDAAVAEVAYQPMQAFYFQTGLTQTSCAQAPQDGILIQTPAGAGKINVRANDVDIQLGSTAFLQAQPGGEMTISLVEGQGEVTADGKHVTVPAGSQVTIPIDNNLHVAGRPGNVQPYDPTLVDPLPIQLLPIQITIAPPATADQIQAANLPSGSTVGGLDVTGINGDLSTLVGLSLDQFCPKMDAALAQANISRADYLDLLNHALTNTSPGSLVQITQVAQMLSSCP